MRHCYVLRVFTRGAEGGNHLGVVTDSTGLDDGAMQKAAAGLGFSETIFLDWADLALPSVRIFTPGSELPFAGHPLVGLAWLLESLGPISPGVVTCGVGEVRFRMEADLAWIIPPSGQPVRNLPGEGRTIVEMPLEYELIRMESPAAVGSASVPTEEVARYLWAWETPEREVKARFFATAVGIDEDPATGSAAVALARVLQHEGTKEGNLEIHQGDEVGAPSTLYLTWSGDRIELGGMVVLDEVRLIRT